MSLIKQCKHIDRNFLLKEKKMEKNFCIFNKTYVVDMQKRLKQTSKQKTSQTTNSTTCYFCAKFLRVDVRHDIFYHFFHEFFFFYRFKFEVFCFFHFIYCFSFDVKIMLFSYFECFVQRLNLLIFFSAVLNLC